MREKADGQWESGMRFRNRRLTKRLGKGMIETLKIVLKTAEYGMTSKEAYDEIIRRKLYTFPAKKPDAVVNSMIRRHCLGLDFPTASPVKYFKIVDYKGKKPCYALIDSKTKTSTAEVPKVRGQSDLLPEEKIQRCYYNRGQHQDLSCRFIVF